MSEKHRRIPELYALEHRHDSVSQDTGASLYNWTSPVIRKNPVNEEFIDGLNAMLELDSSECATVRNFFNRTVEKDYAGHTN